MPFHKPSKKRRTPTVFPKSDSESFIQKISVAIGELLLKSDNCRIGVNTRLWKAASCYLCIGLIKQQVWLFVHWTPLRMRKPHFSGHPGGIITIHQSCVPITALLKFRICKYWITLDGNKVMTKSTPRHKDQWQRHHNPRPLSKWQTVFRPIIFNWWCHHPQTGKIMDCVIRVHSLSRWKSGNWNQTQFLSFSPREIKLFECTFSLQWID